MSSARFDVPKKAPYGSGRKPCAACPPKSSTGPRAKDVFAQGERWQARGAEAFKPGEVVEVANIKDLTLVVRRRPALTTEGGTS